MSHRFITETLDGHCVAGFLFNNIPDFDGAPRWRRPAPDRRHSSSRGRSIYDLRKKAPVSYWQG